jgi:hypothetical protein
MVYKISKSSLLSKAARKATAKKIRVLSSIRKHRKKIRKQPLQGNQVYSSESSSGVNSSKGSSGGGGKNNSSPPNKQPPTGGGSGGGGKPAKPPKKPLLEVGGEQQIHWDQYPDGDKAPDWIPTQTGKEVWAFAKMLSVMKMNVSQVLLGAAEGKGVVYPGSNYIGPLNYAGLGAPPPLSKMDELARIHDLQYGWLIEQGVDAYYTFNMADVYMLENADLTTAEGQAINLFIGAKQDLFPPETTPVPAVPSYEECQQYWKEEAEAAAMEEAEGGKEEGEGEDGEKPPGGDGIVSDPEKAAAEKEAMEMFIMGLVMKTEKEKGIAGVAQLANQHKNLTPQNFESLRLLPGGFVGVAESAEPLTSQGSVGRKYSSVSSASQSYHQSLSSKPVIFKR